ncbi:MAG: hypothetical protein U0841_28745 [Chloroflexia bacterium]
MARRVAVAGMAGAWEAPAEPEEAVAVFVDLAVVLVAAVVAVAGTVVAVAGGVVGVAVAEALATSGADDVKLSLAAGAVRA